MNNSMSFLNRGIQAFQMFGIVGVLTLPGIAAAAPAPTEIIQPMQPNRLAQVTPTPDSAMTPVNGKVTIRFVNETGAAIEYQVVGDTEYRTLAGNTAMNLKDLPVPVTLTFRRQDAGLLQVRFQADSPSGTIVVNVSATTDFALDRTTLYIDQAGRIFFN
jgi:hypothetical protein